MKLDPQMSSTIAVIQAAKSAKQPQAPASEQREQKQISKESINVTLSSEALNRLQQERTDIDNGNVSTNSAGGTTLPPLPDKKV